MKRTLWAIILFCLSSAFKGQHIFNRDGFELTRLKMSLMYVQSIKTFRLLFMSLMGMGICLILLFIGLMLFHISLFLYSPWSMGTKMLVGFLCSFVYLLASFAIFSQVFSSDKWLAIFHADTIIDHFNQDALRSDAVKPAEKN